MARIVRMKRAGGLRLALSFDDGVEKVLDLGPYLVGPLFLPLRDPRRFGRVRLRWGALEWPNGADICPDLLRYEGPAPWARRWKAGRPRVGSAGRTRRR